MKLIWRELGFNSVYFDTEKKEMVSCTTAEFLRYLKGIYTNKERFISRFIDRHKKTMEEYELKVHSEADYVICHEFFDKLVADYDAAEPFSFKESFELSNKEFQALVFSSINITDMITQLGATRIKTDGIELDQKVYDEEGNYLRTEKRSNVYEVHEVSGKKLGLNEKLYVVKCWCTTTEKEHWLWIDEKYKDDPLTAIASTFMVHENVIPHIKCLKRQGDVLLAEMNKEVTPEGEIVSLTKEQYFSLLVAQA
jgi:hypothetical protein